MKKRVWKTIGTALLVVLLGMALCTRHPGNEEDGKMPSLSPVYSAATAESEAFAAPTVSGTSQPAKESPQKASPPAKRKEAFSLLIQGKSLEVWDKVDRETLARGGCHRPCTQERKEPVSFMDTGPDTSTNIRKGKQGGGDTNSVAKWRKTDIYRGRN